MRFWEMRVALFDKRGLDDGDFALGVNCCSQFIDWTVPGRVAICPVPSTLVLLFHVRDEV